jgi:hypothetical protein
VQEHFEKFLEERDIGESTAFFIPEYAAHKEQQVRLLSCSSFSSASDFLFAGIRQLAEERQGLHRCLNNE